MKIAHFKTENLAIYQSILYFQFFIIELLNIFVFDKNRRIKIVHHFRFLFIKIKISYYITVKLVLLIEIEKSFIVLKTHHLFKSFHRQLLTSSVF